MSSAPTRTLLASTSFRLALVCAAVIVLAFAAAGLGAWVVTKSAAEQAGRQRIAAEIDSLQREIADEGVQAAMAAIEARQHAPGALEYQMADANGRILIGDLRIQTPSPGWSNVYLPNTGGGAASPDLLAFSQTLPDGGRLVIAEDLERTEWVRYAVLRTLIWIAAIALVLAVAAGYFANRTTLRQMDSVFLAMERVGRGDLSARVPVSDIGNATDIDALGRGINIMLARIDGLVRNLRRVSTDIAHDLRTPLAHVRQELDAVSGATDLEHAKAAARAAQGKIDDLMRTFAAMLRLAEIDAGAARARFTGVDLSALVERIGDAYRADIQNAQGSLSVEAPPHASIQGDADLLAQALANLLDNAIAHSPTGARIALRLHAGADGVRIEVEDRGPGISEAEREHVLEPFVRLDRSRARPGAGLGLSIVNAIARLHGARLVLADAAPGLRVEMVWPPAAQQDTEAAAATPLHQDAN